MNAVKLKKRPKGLVRVQLYYDRYRGDAVIKMGSTYIKLKSIV
jgi:hypothetical protein